MSTSVSAIEGVEARRGVAEIGGDLRVLPVGRAQRRRDARDHLRIALGPLPRVIDRRRDRELVGRREQQLPRDAEVVRDRSRRRCVAVL